MERGSLRFFQTVTNNYYFCGSQVKAFLVRTWINSNSIGRCSQAQIARSKRGSYRTRSLTCTRGIEVFKLGQSGTVLGQCKLLKTLAFASHWPKCPTVPASFAQKLTFGCNLLNQLRLQMQKLSQVSGTADQLG